MSLTHVLPKGGGQNPGYIVYLPYIILMHSSGIESATALTLVTRILMNVQTQQCEPGVREKCNKFEINRLGISNTSLSFTFSMELMDARTIVI